MVLKIKKNKKRSDIKLACGSGIVVMLGLLLISAALWDIAQLSSDQTNTNTNINMLGQPASAAYHSPIYIDGDDPDHDWDDCDAVTGNGTEEDPYVIADLEIDAVGLVSGILILDSTAYLTIVNCSVSNAGSSGYDAGIMIQSCENVLISKCFVQDCDNVGIFLWYSPGTIVTGNTITNSQVFGILIDNSPATIVAGNTVTNNGEGVLLYDGSQDTEIFSNAISGNVVGIDLYNPGFETIVGNWIWDNTAYEILHNDNGMEWSNYYPDNYYTPYDPTFDTDYDGLVDGDELVHFTSPFKIDTDMDNFLDGYEVLYGTDPLDPLSYPAMPQQWFDLLNASIGDNTVLLETVYALATQNTAYLTALEGHLEGNATEIRAILDELGITIVDTDYDGLDDLDEIVYGTSLTCSDTDCDNLNDAFEVKIGTDPLDDDSDDDSWYDGVEVAAGTNPLSASEYPGSETVEPTSEDPKIAGYPLSVFALLSGIGLVLILKYRKKT